MNQLCLSDIEAALNRVKSYILETPIVTSAQMNRRLGHKVLFKAENLQRVGAFKARGAMNALLHLQEHNLLPEKVVAYSSGNHAQAVSWAASTLELKSEIFMPRNVSQVKLEATRGYGAKVTLCDSRLEAEQLAEAESKKGAYLLPPFDHDQIICGQGTACLQALRQMDVHPDSIFAPCGGGGLLSGTVIAAKGFDRNIKVYGAEPLLANDAVRTLKNGSIFRWKNSPETLADGAKTLSVTKRTLNYLKQLEEIFEITEKEMIYWTQWLCHFLKHHIEPTSALAMAAAQKWLSQQKNSKTILVILSGGNVDNKTMNQIWKEDHLIQPPSNV